MRILFVHPKHRSGGAEIAGMGPPAWGTYLTGRPRRAGFGDVHFIDAMIEGVSDEKLPLPVCLILRTGMAHGGGK